jgi:hypothetical protein
LTRVKEHTTQVDNHTPVGLLRLQVRELLLRACELGLRCLSLTLGTLSLRLRVVRLPVRASIRILFRSSCARATSWRERASNTRASPASEWRRARYVR